MIRFILPQHITTTTNLRYLHNTPRNGIGKSDWHMSCVLTTSGRVYTLVPEFGGLATQGT